MFKRIGASKLLLSVVVLLLLASPASAADADESRLEAFERFTASSTFTSLFFFLPADRMWGAIDEVSTAHREFRILVKRLKPVGTFPVFEHFGTKSRTGPFPNVISLKQLDLQEMIDWEVAVTRDLKEVAVAVNIRF